MEIVTSLTAVDYEAITVSAAAIGLTASKVSPADKPAPAAVLITVETATCRFRMDGINPTSTEGHQLSTGDHLLIVGLGNLNNFKAIIDTGADSTLRVTYLR